MKNTKQNLKIKLLCFAILASILVGCSSIKFSQKHKQNFYTPEALFIENPKVVLVLGSGGAKGSAHVGVIEELLNAKIKPDLIVGSSSGALVGAIFADSLSIAKTKEIVLKTQAKNIRDISLSHLRYSIGSGKRLTKYLSEKLSAKTFEELKMPLIAVATNLQYGDAIAFAKGPLIKALNASAAYPGVFFPVKIDEQYFVDGGVASPVPVEIAKRFNPKLIIAVDIGEELTGANPNHMLGLIKRCMEISYLNHSKSSVANADVVIDVPFIDVGTFNDSNNQKLYEQGKMAAIKAIPQIKKLLENF